MRIAMLALICLTLTAQPCAGQEEGNGTVDPVFTDPFALMGGVMCCSLCLIFFVFIPIWMFFDSYKRGMNFLTWGMVGVALGPIGLAIYIYVSRYIYGIESDKNRRKYRPRRKAETKRTAKSHPSYGMRDMSSLGPYSQPGYSRPAPQQGAMVEFQEQEVSFGPSRSNTPPRREREPLPEFGVDEDDDFVVAHSSRGRRAQALEEWPDEVDAEVEDDFDEFGMPRHGVQEDRGEHAENIRKGKCPSCMAVLEVDMSKAKGPIVITCPGCGSKSKWQ